MSFSFAVSYSRLVSDSFSIKKEARAVTTKTWVKSNSNNLGKYAGMLFNNNADKHNIIKTVLSAGYGANVGEQIYNALSDQAINKIADNIKTFYN